MEDSPSLDSPVFDSPSDSSNDSMNSSSSESDIVSPDSGKGIGTRKRRRRVKKSNYLQGKCRKVYKLNKGLNKSLQDSPVSISGVCTSCSPSLQQISDGFEELKHRGSELKSKSAVFQLQNNLIVSIIEMCPCKMSGSEIISLMLWETIFSVIHALLKHCI